jgi:hypothetical protein
MTLDRPYDEGANDAPLERRVQRGGSGADSAATMAESRSRLEYYEVLHATDSDRRTGRSGWDMIDAGNRPQLDAIGVSPERTKHILDGEAKGSGGHRHGVGKPGKTEFPQSWDDTKIMNHILDVARRPDSQPVHQHWNDRWVCGGTRDGIEVSVVVLRTGEIWTAWPEEGGPGVIRNPPEEKS